MNQQVPTDRDRLVDIIDKVHAILKQLVEDHGEYVLIEFVQDSEYQGLLSDAWSRAKERLHDIRSQLAPDRHAPEDELPEGLEEVGLRGRELALKHFLLGRLWARFRTSKTSLWLRRLLGCMNSILGSLSGVLPGTEAVGELKDMIEQTLKVARKKQVVFTDPPPRRKFRNV